MKDFNLAKYLKENYQGPFSMFQPYANLNPLKEESEEQLDSAVPYEGPDPRLDGMGSDFDQVDPVEEDLASDLRGDLEKTSGLSMADPIKLKELAKEFLRIANEMNPDLFQNEINMMKRLANYLVTNPDKAKEGIKNIDASGFRGSEFYDDVFNTIDDIYPELLTIWDIQLIPEAYGPDTEQGNFDRMMGLIDTDLMPELPNIKKAVNKARQMGLKDMQIFNMLKTNSLTAPTISNLIDDGFDEQDIVDFFATDFSMNKDSDFVDGDDIEITDVINGENQRIPNDQDFELGTEFTVVGVVDDYVIARLVGETQHNFKLWAFDKEELANKSIKK